MNSRTLYTTIAGFQTLAIALTLIGSPVSVFAQSEASMDVIEVSDLVFTEDIPPTSDVEDSSANALPATGTQAVNTYADTYTKEMLPNNDVFGDFVVGPGRFEFELSPGQTRTVELLVSNRMGERKLFSFMMEDAEGSATGETAINLLGERVGPYTVKDFISVPHEQFYLEHAQRARIPVTISIPADAEPGGRYGSILTSITTDPNQIDSVSGAAPSTAVISRIGTLFFIKTPGEVGYEGQTIDFSTLNKRSFYLNGPIDFLITYENTGSVHTTPYGRVSITNIIGQDVGVVELQPWFVLPKSLRTRELQWNREFLIGRYTATAEINRGYGDIIDTYSYSFWVFPWKIMLGGFAVVFVFFLLLRFIFTRFEFKRKA